MNRAITLRVNIISMTMLLLLVTGAIASAQAASNQMTAPIEAVHVQDRIVVMFDVPYRVADNAVIRSAAGLTLSLSQLHRGMTVNATVQPVAREDTQAIITQIQVVR